MPESKWRGVPVEACDGLTAALLGEALNLWLESRVRVKTELYLGLKLGLFVKRKSPHQVYLDILPFCARQPCVVSPPWDSPSLKTRKKISKKGERKKQAQCPNSETCCGGHYAADLPQGALHSSLSYPGEEK